MGSLSLPAVRRESSPEPVSGAFYTLTRRRFPRPKRPPSSYRPTRIPENGFSGLGLTTNGPTGYLTCEDILTSSLEPRIYSVHDTSMSTFIRRMSSRNCDEFAMSSPYRHIRMTGASLPPPFSARVTLWREGPSSSPGYPIALSCHATATIYAMPMPCGSGCCPLPSNTLTPATYCLNWGFGAQPDNTVLLRIRSHSVQVATHGAALPALSPRDPGITSPQFSWKTSASVAAGDVGYSSRRISSPARLPRRRGASTGFLTVCK